MNKAETLKRLAQTAVLKAAGYLIRVLESGERPTVSVKNDASLVLSFDLECERIISQTLGEALPILCEEDESTHGIMQSSSDYFLIDPLDGTTSCRRFLNGQGGQVGYGPLVGLVLGGRLVAAHFYHIPQRRIYSAALGEGLYALDLPKPELGLSNATPRRVAVLPSEKLNQAGVLFLVGKLGETKVIQFLKDHDAIENIYRFGGFANDCTRLAEGYEQISVQFSVKAWDYSAALLAHEAGLDVRVDPLGRGVPFAEWKIEANNPVIISNPGITKELFSLLMTMK